MAKRNWIRPRVLGQSTSHELDGELSRTSAEPLHATAVNLDRSQQRFAPRSAATPKRPLSFASRRRNK
jgi:hypothetical protein